MPDLSFLWMFILGYSLCYFERNEKMKELIRYIEKKTHFIKKTRDLYMGGKIFDSPFVKDEMISSPDDRYFLIEKFVKDNGITKIADKLSK